MPQRESNVRFRRQSGHVGAGAHLTFPELPPLAGVLHHARALPMMMRADGEQLDGYSQGKMLLN